MPPRNGDLRIASLKRGSCPRLTQDDLHFPKWSCVFRKFLKTLMLTALGATPALCKKWQPQSGVQNENFLHDFQGARTAYGILIQGLHQGIKR